MNLTLSECGADTNLAQAEQDKAKWDPNPGWLKQKMKSEAHPDTFRRLLQSDMADSQECPRERGLAVRASVGN